MEDEGIIATFKRTDDGTINPPLVTIPKYTGTITPKYMKSTE